MNQEELAKKLWEEAGKPEGRDDEFWFAAEKQLKEEHWRTYDPYANDIDAVLWETIMNGLVDCIKAHGPIKSYFITSATKRVLRGIVENEEFRELCSEDVHNKLIVKSLQKHYEIRLADEIRYRTKKEVALTQKYTEEVKQLKEEKKKRETGQKIHNTGIENSMKKLREKLKTATDRVKELEFLLMDGEEKEKLEVRESKYKQLKRENAKLEEKILELSRQVASWRVLAEGVPTVKEETLPVFVLPQIPAIEMRR